MAETPKKAKLQKGKMKGANMQIKQQTKWRGESLRAESVCNMFPILAWGMEETGGDKLSW